MKELRSEVPDLSDRMGKIEGPLGMLREFFVRNGLLDRHMACVGQARPDQGIRYRPPGVVPAAPLLWLMSKILHDSYQGRPPRAFC